MGKILHKNFFVILLILTIFALSYPSPTSGKAVVKFAHVLNSDSTKNSSKVFRLANMGQMDDDKDPQMDSKKTTTEPPILRMVDGGSPILRGGGGGCGARFLPTALNEQISNKCVQLIGMKLENFPPKMEDLIKINYDDMCFSKCYLTEIGYVSDTDNFDTTVITQDIKSTTGQDKVAAKIASTNKCIKYTEDMAREEGGVANSPCKYSLVFFMCQREAERKACPFRI